MNLKIENEEVKNNLKLKIHVCGTHKLCVCHTHTYVHVQTLSNLTLKGQFKMRKCKKPQMQKKQSDSNGKGYFASLCGLDD